MSFEGTGVWNGSQTHVGAFSTNFAPEFGEELGLSSGKFAAGEAVRSDSFVANVAAGRSNDGPAIS